MFDGDRALDKAKWGGSRAGGKSTVLHQEGRAAFTWETFEKRLEDVGVTKWTSGRVAFLAEATALSWW